MKNTHRFLLLQRASRMGAALAILAVSGTLTAGPEGFVEPFAVFESIPPAVERFSMSSENNILGQDHLWVNGGGMSVNPTLDDVAGLGNMVAPPWATAGHRLEVTFNGKRIKPELHHWRPGEFERVASLAPGIKIRSLVATAFGKRGLLQWVELHNTSGTTSEVTVQISSTGGFGSIDPEQWTFAPPTRFNGLPAIHPQSVRPGWARSIAGDSAIVTACNLPGLRFHNGRFNGGLKLSPGQKTAFAIAIAAGQARDAGLLVQKMIEAPHETIKTNRSLWEERISSLYQNAPRLRSSNRDLVDFYDRSLLSLLTARWDLPELAANPWYATSGLDGGALCAYVWDYAYASRICALVTPQSAREFIRLFLKADLTRGYALLPFGTRITGVRYSYSDYSLIRLIHNYVMITGDRGFLNESIGNSTVWDLAYKHAVHLEDLSKPVELIDYGRNHNLLELRRTENYTRFVPSPNAERCWAYHAVDELARIAGRPAPGLSVRAEQLATRIRKSLWMPRERWFASLDHAGNQHRGDSIQVFDLLRFDIPNAEQRAGMLSHLNEEEFLSRWGVHSYSKKSVGYDSHDVDWGGPGVYTGDAPELVGDLLHARCFGHADDVLSRILWWGQSLPYYPQAIRADRRDYRRDGRANVIAGAAAAEMMIFDLLGLRIGENGSVEIDPHLPSFANDLRFDGLTVRGLKLCIVLEADGYAVKCEGHPTLRAKYGVPIRISSRQTNHGED